MTRTQTIDELILRTLASHPLVSARDLSETWGEDERKCQEWLDKFAREGLCWHRTVTWGEGRAAATLSGYVGVKAKIVESLKRKAEQRR